MRKTGKNFLYAVLLLFCINVSAAEISTEIDDNVIGLDESTMLQIKVSDVKSVEPLQLPVTDRGLGLGYAGITKSRQWINGVSWSGFILQYRVTGLKEGSYVIPSIHFMADGKEYGSDSVKLTVSSKVRTRPKSLLDQFFGNDGNPVFDDNETEVEIETEISKTEIYLGQPVIVRIFVVTNSPQGIKVRSIDKDTDESDFYIKPVDEKIEDRSFEDHGVLFYRQHLQTYIYIPISPGTFKINGGKAVYYQQEAFSVVTKTRAFEGKNIRVASLPSGLQEPVYTGSYKMEFDKTKIKKSDAEASFQIKLSGSGNFAMPIDWTVLKHDGFNVLTSVSDAQIGISGNDVAGSYTYDFTVIPDDSSECEIENIFINTYDPEIRLFKKIETGPFEFSFKKQGLSEEIPVSGSSSFSGLFTVIIISSVMIFLSVAAFSAFLILEKRRSSRETEYGVQKKSELKKRVTERLNSDKKLSTANEHIIELKSALRSSNRERTITVIEKSIVFLKESGHGSEQLDQISEMISLSRFAGAGLSNETLSRIINDVADMIKEIR
ncbi:MAG: BatD family protein [Spirochaetes bacterium]|nr:BatD family protein [Spirochaetota bacterium]